MATIAPGRSRALLPLNRTPRTKGSNIVMPKSAHEWEKLMRLAIEKADALKDRRVHGLRKALVDGKAERVLRMMGIIHLGDLSRVFPEKA